MELKLMNKKVILISAALVFLGINSAVAEEKSYTIFDIKYTKMDFETCLGFIGESPEAAKKVGLELGDPEIIAEDMDNKLLVVKFPLKSPVGPGFAKVTCVDGAVVRGQYLYDKGA